jgi:hypothetical protein
MACESFRERLVDLLYDEMGSSERAAIEAHVAECRECRGEMERLAEARSLLAGAAGAVPPAPRVVVLEPSLARRPWVGIAAGAFLAGALASAGFFAGMRAGAEGAGRQGSPAQAVSPAAPDVEALQASFERRLEEQRRELRSLIEEKQQAPVVTRGELAAAVDKLERKVDGWRSNDVGYLLGQLAAVDKRQSTQIGQTQEALRYVALSRDPRVSEQ